MKQNKNPMDSKKLYTEYPISQPGELLEFLLTAVKNASRNNVKSLLKWGAVLVNGKPVSQFNHPLKAGDVVRVNRPGAEAPECPLRVIYEDEELLVVNKPAGLLSVANDKERERTAYSMLTDYMRRKDPHNRLFVVHRLDKDTSGVFLIAKNEQLKHDLQDAWDELVTQRGYFAVVEGQLSKPQGTVRSWLKENSIHLMYSSQKEGDGQEAITDYQVVRESGEFSLVDIRLQTGRKNQIRVHMKDLGHCVAGDKKYGASTNPLGRLGLHAHRLELRHPATGKLMCFDAPLPRAFSELIKDGGQVRKK